MQTLLPMLLAACPLLGQAVSLTVSAVTPMTAHASANGTNVVQSLPAGPLPPTGTVYAQVDASPTGEMASIWLDWQTQQPIEHERLRFRCDYLGQAWGVTSPASASIDPFDLLLHIQAPTPRRVFVAGLVDVSTSPGTPAPLLEFDLFVDGTVEWSTTVSWAPISVLVGPAPIPIRIRGAINLPSSGLSAGNAFIDITPDNQIDIIRLLNGCTGDGFLRLEEAFAHDGVRLRVPTSTLCVGVLGLGLQPIVLPAYLGFPCVLLPSPDVLLVIPPNGFDLPIPAAARPIDFYAQVVWADTLGLATTTGYRTSAY